MSAAGFTQLQSLIARMKRAGSSSQELAREVAPVLQAELEQNISEGRDTYGAEWKPTQDGKTPLRNAAKALKVEAKGNTVVATLTGPEARHHSGTARGRVKRRILPGSNAVPPKVIEAIKTAFAEKLKRKG